MGPNQSIKTAPSGSTSDWHTQGLHCLRHSYVTHLIEAGYDPTFVQAQVGHAYASTTSLYTSVSSDFKHKALQQMIARRIAQAQEERHA